MDTAVFALVRHLKDMYVSCGTDFGFRVYNEAKRRGLIRWDATAERYVAVSA
jgi:hypothetical protein